jgi:fructose-specific phosphotransferase system IIA component
MNMTETMAVLVLQIGIILFAVRLGGRAVKPAGIPPVLGELLAGIVIGPYALGGIPVPGFPQGVFAAAKTVVDGGNAGLLAVSGELYGFATVASIILLFASGLETDIGLFLRYSVAGGIIGIGGVAASFALGTACGMVLLHTGFADPRCLFLGILSTATSVGITARILQDNKKMDSPEGVTILAAAVFDDVLGIIGLAVVLGIVAVLTGHAGGGLSAPGILLIAGKAFGIWLGFTALGLVFSRQFAGFLKLFKSSFDFSVLALGAALILAGIFEKQGLAMIIGAYVSGLSLSKTDIAAVVQERLHGLYEFFVPIFFAVMGMMVNVREIVSAPVLIFGAVYTATAIVSKIAGCGGPALLLGFNLRGAFRIGAGMVPRGEVALIIAGIGLASGILDPGTFSVVILMTLVTTLAAPPILSAFLRLPGRGTVQPRKKDEDSEQADWDFSSSEIAAIVAESLLKDLRSEGFYVQMMDIDEGLSQARKDDIALSISREESSLSIKTSPEDMPFAKTAVYEVILGLSELIGKLKESSDPKTMKRELSGLEGRASEDVLSLVTPEHICLDLRGQSKRDVITELVDLLASQGGLLDRDAALQAVLEREKTMSTGMEHGIALPHGKTDAVNGIQVAVGVKKAGVDFESLDGRPSRLFILVISPNKHTGPHIQFLAAIAAVLKDGVVREEVIGAETREDAARLLTHTGK